MRNAKYSELGEQQRKLLDAANEASEKAYSPYSNFSVGAAILTTDGDVITGSNVENASYSLTCCAERAAVHNANSQGKREFRSIAVIGSGGDINLAKTISPCGACLQVIHEFAQITGMDPEIIMSSADKNNIIICTLSELMPLAFGADNLNIAN